MNEWININEHKGVRDSKTHTSAKQLSLQTEKRHDKRTSALAYSLQNQRCFTKGWFRMCGKREVCGYSTACAKTFCGGWEKARNKTNGRQNKIRSVKLASISTATTSPVQTACPSECWTQRVPRTGRWLGTACGLGSGGRQFYWLGSLPGSEAWLLLDAT